ncbi:c-type cytochrome [Rhizobium bangladeshense]|uniref:c-type cytochrome n=1 Tax=Rhizobium bangladeshense TaxID=1138189 RepID=UPI0007E53DF6|nr:cytochrome c family protein [Rhizobium bangladeshense]
MKKLVQFAALAVSAATIASSSAHADGDPDKGKKLFARCSACHAMGDQNKVGPGLQKVVGRPAGAVAGYNYSAAMKSSGLTWDDATLDAFLKAPQATVKGTRMNLSVPKDQDRADVIAYLKTLTAQ